MKKQRSDYTLLGAFEFTLKGESYYVRVLVDSDELLAGQGELARASKHKRNKQDYGPFRVTVTAAGADGALKQKRKRTTMKSKKKKREEAAERRARYEARSKEEQLRQLAARPGKSKKERAHLEKEKKP